MRKRISLGVFCLLFSASLLVCACSSSVSSSKTLETIITSLVPVTSPELTAQPGDSTIVVNYNLPKLSLDQLISYSEVILVGKVVEIKPPKSGFVYNTISPTIYTDIIVQPERYLYGGSGTQNIAIRVQGGKVGNEVVQVSGGTSFSLGEETILFLFRQSTDNLAPFTPVPEGIDPTNYFSIVGVSLGKWQYVNGKATDVFGVEFDISDIQNRIMVSHG